MVRTLGEKHRLEGFNRARDLFGDPFQRRDNRLCFKGKSNIEEYRSGRMALILYSEGLSEVCPEFCVNGQDLFLGMGRRGRGQFPFPGSSL
jgi:hypothetical protein